MVEVREAATVMLVRDRPELEVLVLRRTPDAIFGPGATVFPGGAVDPADHEAARFVTGIDDAAASAEHGLRAGGLVFRIAAVRECFEEAGILLARDSRTDEPAVARPEWRDACNCGDATLAEVLADGDLVVGGRELRVFSHWLTPVGAPRRYDTWFFVAPARDGDDGLHDDVELVHSEWVRPRDALARGRRGDIELILPTLRSLETLARFGSAAELLDVLDAVPRTVTGSPIVVTETTGERVLLPGDDAMPHRSWTIPLPDVDFATEAVLAGGGAG